jgi:hypothetical protein
MPLWGWVLLGLLCWVAVSVVFAFGLARLFGRLGRQDMTVSEYEELLEFELWSRAPLTRARTMVEHEEMIELALSGAARVPRSPSSRRPSTRAGGTRSAPQVVL